MIPARAPCEIESSLFNTAFFLNDKSNSRYWISRDDRTRRAAGTVEDFQVMEGAWHRIGRVLSGSISISDMEYASRDVLGGGDMAM